METIEELQAFLADATVDGAWGQLLNRGTAWSIMRQDGQLPPDSPSLGETIETDLAEYGFSVLRASLALKEATGDADLCLRGFTKAANAFEALVRNGASHAVERGFYRIVAGASYHLAGYSAIAYSLFSERGIDPNVAPAEEALMRLILRDLDALRIVTRDWLLNEAHSDETLGEGLENGVLDVEDAIAIILNSAINRALAYFNFALQTGEASLVDNAKGILTTGLRLAGEAGAIPLWWIARLCLNLISDLWGHSLHVNLPTQLPSAGEEAYAGLRSLLLASLYGRRNAEIELWPSQLEAARRSADLSDDLVVALPTSAGKTRVAEIAALMTLASKKRVLIVTPLRALSAQTERAFRKTFAPLGFTVSSLYGASGVSATDEDALRATNIVIATPEKLDFALRSDPTLIGDIGLVVLDEGHMIGPTEREIRYETLVQRLLRRADAANRRIVCLSAILPAGEQLDDLTAWIRGDAPGSPIQADWRPTRQRFGTLLWQGRAAKLSFDLNAAGPYLARFVEEVPARGRQKLPYPRETKDLTLFAAWKFASQGKKVLIFITQANWVEGYGKAAIDLVKRGYLPGLLEDTNVIARALEVGREWLGDGHPAVEALKIGVAIHHGGLPNPFLRELEILLSEGALKVTAASPTLSQGLNLNAAVLLVPTLHRSSEVISGEEFANVAGRAGRAFVDVEGLVVHVMHAGDEWREGLWRKLVQSAKSRTLKSGLIQVVAEILSRLAQEGVLTRNDALEYLANSREAWKSFAEETTSIRPKDVGGDGEEPDAEDPDHEPLSYLVEKLDTTVFGLIDALDADRADLPKLLDEALQGSLWARQIVRESEDVQRAHREILKARANLIWSNTTALSRRGHFAMGVGLEAGLALDAMADELARWIDNADTAALSGYPELLGEALAELARRLLVLRPFIPDKRNPLPDSWEAILKAWVSGEDVETIGPENMRLVEDAFTYRLVWALEALRIRRTTLGWSSDFIAGGGAASLETGVPQFMMSMLIRAGLPSRRAAMAAIRGSNALFADGPGMRSWLRSEEIAALTSKGDWPTPETASLWNRFRDDVLSGGVQKWTESNSKHPLNLQEGDFRLPNGIYRLEIDDPQRAAWVCTPDYRRVAMLKTSVNDPKPSFFAARFVEGEPSALIQRFGRDEATWLA
ncbi:MAG TPA: DEAD/DEAH box helicase [Bryobacteraceae bacterium]